MASLEDYQSRHHIWPVRFPILNREASMDKLVGQGVKFERTRRITGYLVGTLERFNNAKAAEVRDRVTHSGVEYKEPKKNAA